MRLFWLVLLLLVACRPSATPSSRERLTDDPRVSVTVLHFGTGARDSVRGDVRSPMMSVFKLPLAIVALELVEEGTFALDRKIAISESELRRGVSPIAGEWDRGTHEFTLETMLIRVLQDSDNTAGDKLVTLEGGGPAITAKLRSMGIEGIDIVGQEIDSARKNTATTDALVDMLAKIERGPILTPKSRAWLQGTLAGTKTGARRLKALLPPGTRVEHKTGTEPHVATNDIGVITLPNNERFAIAVMVIGATNDDEAEAAIARTAKSAWDRFNTP